MTLAIEVAASIPATSTSSACPSSPTAGAAAARPVARGRSAELGFEGKAGQTLAVPVGDRSVDVVAVGLGDAGRADHGRRCARRRRRWPAPPARRPRWRPRWPTSTPGVDPRGGGAGGGRGVRARRLPLHGLQDGAGSPRPRAGRRCTAGAGDRAAVAAGSARGAGHRRGRRTWPATWPTRRRPPDSAVDLAERADRRSRPSASSPSRCSTTTQMAELGLRRHARRQPRLDRAAPPGQADLQRPAAPSGTVALVGKGIMYDSGGISPQAVRRHARRMKMDMSGAAAVLAAMSAAARRSKPKVKVIGYLCCTDNMPSGSAMKLGDVLTIRNGTTVEIHNTDAEGRLVLADGLSLAVEEQPDAIVDIATLTGAVHGALGHEDRRRARQRPGLGRPGPRRRPTGPTSRCGSCRCRRATASCSTRDVADMKNIGGPYGGAITAALFLREFVGDVPWAHLDIAGLDEQRRRRRHLHRRAPPASACACSPTSWAATRPPRLDQADSGA